MKMTFRWYGSQMDPIPLRYIKQIPNMSGVVSSLMDMPAGALWPTERIRALKQEVNDAGLELEVIESVNIHEDIKLGLPSRDEYIDNYRQTVARLGQAGVKVICYNFMPVFDWTRTDLAKPRFDGATVLAYDQYRNPALEGLVRYVGLEALLRTADLVSLHCPLTDQTRYMINGDAIGKMKPGVILINTGRGQLIHTEALIEGLKEKKIGAAGLDVYEEEAAYFYEDTSDRIMDDDILARLLSFNNVIMTSHQGFFTREALDSIAHTTLQNINDFDKHRKLVNEVRAEPEKAIG